MQGLAVDFAGTGVEDVDDSCFKSEEFRRIGLDPTVVMLLLCSNSSISTCIDSSSMSRKALDTAKSKVGTDDTARSSFCLASSAALVGAVVGTGVGVDVGSSFFGACVGFNLLDGASNIFLLTFSPVRL